METDDELRSRLIEKYYGDGGEDCAMIFTAYGVRLDDLASLHGLKRKGESMAKLSERTERVPQVENPLMVRHPITNKIQLNEFRGETNMTTNNTGTLRVINLTLVDNNPNLKVEGKVVFQKLGHMTEHNDERTIQQILMSGDVAEALEKHNAKRVKVVDKEIQRATGRDVKLEEVEIFNLDWQVVRVA
jgi:hypothetical protein